MDTWEENIKGQLAKVKRVEPGPELFQKIEQQINRPAGKAVNISLLKAVAAAVIMILLNVAVLWTASDNKQSTDAEASTTYSVVSNYNIYGNE